MLRKAGGRGSKSILTYNSHLYILYFPLAWMIEAEVTTIYLSTNLLARKGSWSIWQRKSIWSSTEGKGIKHLNSLAAVIDVEMSVVITNNSGEKQRQELLLKLLKSGLVVIDGKVPLGEHLWCTSTLAEGSSEQSQRPSVVREALNTLSYPSIVDFYFSFCIPPFLPHAKQ